MEDLREKQSDIDRAAANLDTEYQKQVCLPETLILIYLHILWQLLVQGYCI